MLLRADGDLLRADCECGRWGKHPWCVAWRRLLCNLLGCWLLRKRMGLRLLRRRLLNNWLALWLLLGRLGRRWLNLRHGRLLLNRWLLCHWLLHRGLLCPKKVRETEGCFCNWQVCRSVKIPITEGAVAKNGFGFYIDHFNHIYI